MRYNYDPFSQAEHDDALRASVFVIVAIVVVALICLAMIAYILFNVVPAFVDTVSFAIKVMWFLAFQLFG